MIGGKHPRFNRNNAMKQLLLVGLGGFVGAVVRWKAGGWLLHLTLQEKFPYPTFSVNVAGCLAIGLLAGLAERHDMFGQDARLFLFTGLLGGFTTFSAFGLETLFLLRRGEPGIAALYVTTSVVASLAAVWLGLRMTGVQPTAL